MEKTEQMLNIASLSHKHIAFFGSLWRFSLSSDLAQTRRNLGGNSYLYWGNDKKNVFLTNKAEIFIRLNEPLKAQFGPLNMGHVIYDIIHFSIFQIFYRRLDLNQNFFITWRNSAFNNTILMLFTPQLFVYRILGFYLSGFVLIVISLDRLSAIIYPLAHR